MRWWDCSGDLVQATRYCTCFGGSGCFVGAGDGGANATGGVAGWGSAKRRQIKDNNVEDAATLGAITKT